MKDLADELNEVILYVNGTVAPGTISVIMTKEYALAHAKALTEAAEALGPGQKEVGFMLEGHMIPKNKAMVSNIDYTKKEEEEAGDADKDGEGTLQ